MARDVFLRLGLAWMVLGASTAVEAAEPVVAAVTGGVGVDEVFGGHDRRVVYELELAFAELGGGFSPVVEGTLSGRESAFVGAGLAWRAESAAGFGLRVAVAPGVYDHGEGKDLGGHFQVMSFVEGTWRVTEHGRAGLRLAHLSNASTRGTNPGTEILSLTYAFDWR